MDEFKPGELFVYTRDGNCEHMELGQVKSKVDGETYACWYSMGDTTARTNVRNMRKLANGGWSHVERGRGDIYRLIRDMYRLLYEMCDEYHADDLHGFEFRMHGMGFDLKAILEGEG